MPQNNIITTFRPGMGVIDRTTAVPGSGVPYSTNLPYSGTWPYGGADTFNAQAPVNDRINTLVPENDSMVVF